MNLSSLYLQQVYKFRKVDHLYLSNRANDFDIVVPEVLNELHRSQESGYNMRDNVRQHFLNRAKICSKIIKYPHLEDYAVWAPCWCLAVAYAVAVGVERARRQAVVHCKTESLRFAQCLCHHDRHCAQEHYQGDTGPS